MVSDVNLHPYTEDAYFTATRAAEPAVAGQAGSPGVVMVDYPKWSAAFGHDDLTVTNGSSTVVVKGNEFGATEAGMRRVVSGSVAQLTLGKVGGLARARPRGL